MPAHIKSSMFGCALTYVFPNPYVLFPMSIFSQVSQQNIKLDSSFALLQDPYN